MNAVSCLEEAWRSPQSARRFHYRVWAPPAARRLLILIHGFGEHGGRYDPIARALAESGILVIAPDLWGHGRSEGGRGDLGSVSECVEELRRFADSVALPLVPGEETYALYGHSFGGLTAIAWACRDPQRVRRAVIQSPLLDLGFPVPRWKTGAGRWLARWWPAAPLPMDLDAAMLSHDSRVVEAYRSDPLVHNRMSAGTYRSILQARDEAFERAGELRMPVLLLCGAEDRIVSVDAATRWFNRLACEKRCVVFPGCYHELHHEAAYPDLVRLIVDWILGTDHVAPDGV